MSGSEGWATGRGISRRAFVGKAAGALAVTTGVGWLAGCGGDDESADGKVRLKFWKYQDPATQPILEGLVKRYNAEHPNVEVVLETFPFDQYLAEKVTSALSSGSGPDVFWVSAGTLLNFAPNGLLLPINDAFTDKERADFLPQSLDVITLGDDIYGVPHEMGVQGLLYDKQLFGELGLEPPRTWDDLRTSAEAIKQERPWGVMLPTAPDVFQNFIWFPFLWMGGGEVVSEDWSAARINEEPGVEALRLWGDLVKTKLAAPKSSGPFGEELAQGKAGMAALGMWVVGNYRKTAPDLDLGVVPLPAPSGAQSLAAFGGWYTGVSSATKHPDEAKAFAVWLFGQDPKNAVEFLTPQTLLSPRESVVEQLRETPEFKEPPLPEFLDIWPNTRAEPAYPPEINKAITDALQSVMFGGTDAQKAADEAASAIDSYLKSSAADKIKAIIAA